MFLNDFFSKVEKIILRLNNLLENIYNTSLKEHVQLITGKMSRFEIKIYVY